MIGRWGCACKSMWLVAVASCYRNGARLPGISKWRTAFLGEYEPTSTSTCAEMFHEDRRANQRVNRVTSILLFFLQGELPLI